MNFNETVLEHLSPIFEKYHLLLFEQRQNYLRFQSKILTVIIVHNELENSNTVWLGKSDKLDLVELDNNILTVFFESHLKLSQVSVDDFIVNLALFFEGDGKPLMEDPIKVIELEDFDLNRNREYTKNILIGQKLAIADNAWKNKDYDTFIKILDEIEQGTLPPSYKLKYKIAGEKK